MAYEGPQSGDIRATLALSQSEAQTGSSRTLTLPGGRRITVPVRAGIRNGEQILLKGMGEPAWSGGPAGDLILTVSIAPSEQYGSQPNFIDDPSSPTDFIQPSSVPPTIQTPEYPVSYPPPGSTPNYNEYGQYGSSAPNYPPAGSGGSYPNYQDQTQAQEPLYLYQNQPQYAEPSQYGGYPQAGQQYTSPPPPKKRGMSPIVIILIIVLVLILLAGSGFIYFVGVYQPQKMHADATATVNAQITSTAQANAQATANALATSTAQANATATAQASATAAASATATAYCRLF